MYKVDLNSDLGESFGAYTIGLDNEVIAHVSSVNVACGYHAGDPLVMEKTVAAAKAAGVAVGAHPGFPRSDGLWPQEHGRLAQGGQGVCQVSARRADGLRCGRGYQAPALQAPRRSLQHGW